MTESGVSNKITRDQRYEERQRGFVYGFFVGGVVCGFLAYGAATVNDKRHDQPPSKLEATVSGSPSASSNGLYENK